MTDDRQVFAATLPGCDPINDLQARFSGFQDLGSALVGNRAGGLVHWHAYGSQRYADAAATFRPGDPSEIRPTFTWAAFAYAGARSVTDVEITAVQEPKRSPFENSLSFLETADTSQLANWIASQNFRRLKAKEAGHTERAEQLAHSVRDMAAAGWAISAPCCARGARRDDRQALQLLRRPPAGCKGIETVDHFRPKSHDLFHELVCTWSNLFLTCTACNHAKREQWDEALLRPDDADFRFERYFEVRFESGRLEPATAASAADQHRARRTSEIFDLNRPGLLRNRRWIIQEMRRGDIDEPDDSWAYRYLLALCRRV